MDKMPTILVVDDDIATCNFVGEILTGDGYKCEIALNAHEALDKLKNYHFDIALLDIKLPDKSGIELLEGFPSFFKTTSIIMMTAVRDFNVVIRAMKMGASDYVVKPFTINKLTASISEVLKNKKRYHSNCAHIEKLEDINQDEKTVSQSTNAINAIAMGVDAQVDYFDFHSEIVTDKTVDLARRFNLPEKEIEKWKNMRNSYISDKRRYLQSLLSRLERNPFAQLLLGQAHLNIKFSWKKREQN